MPSLRVARPSRLLLTTMDHEPRSRTSWLVGALLARTQRRVSRGAAGRVAAHYLQVALHAVLGLAFVIGGVPWVCMRRSRLDATAWVAVAVMAQAARSGSPSSGLAPRAVPVAARRARGHVGGSRGRRCLGHAATPESHPLGRLTQAFGVALALVALAGAAATVAVRTRDARRRKPIPSATRSRRPPRWTRKARAARALLPLVGPTNTGGIIPSNFFMTSETCGRCHKDIYEQWNASAHHFSSFNNQWYRKSIEYMQDVVGTQALEVVRRLPRPRGVVQRPLRHADQGADRHARGAGRAGLHVVPRHRSTCSSTMGQGDFDDRVPAAARSRRQRAASAPLVARQTAGPRPATAPRGFLKPFHTEQTPEFCSSCHKVHLDVPVNGYRWIRGFNDYDNWQASGVSGQGARSFYYAADAEAVSPTATCRSVASKDPAATTARSLAPVPRGQHGAARSSTATRRN